jgi:hypothetical protein
MWTQPASEPIRQSSGGPQVTEPPWEAVSKQLFPLTLILAATLFRNDAAELDDSLRFILTAAPSHNLYLYEKKRQKSNALFPFLYNGFRDSLFNRTYAACGDTLVALPKYPCAGLLRPAARFVLLCAAPQLFDNCIKSTSAGASGATTLRAGHASVTRSNSLSFH